jgi:hypothetical protein
MASFPEQNQLFLCPKELLFEQFFPVFGFQVQSLRRFFNHLIDGSIPKAFFNLIVVPNGHIASNISSSG